MTTQKRKPKHTEPSKWRKPVYSILLGFALFLLSNLSFHLSWLAPEEAIVTKCTQLKKNVGSWLPGGSYDKQFIEKNFLLVNVSNDYSLSGNKDSAGGLQGNQYPITDRKKLTALLKWCTEHPGFYQKIFCDLIFLDPSTDASDDDSLGFYIDLLQHQSKIFFAGLYDTYHGQYLPSVLEEMRIDRFVGAVNEQQSDGKLSFYKLTDGDGSIHSFPLMMYKAIDSADVTKASLGFLQVKNTEGSSYMANQFFPEMLFDEAYFGTLKRCVGGCNDSTVAVMDLGQAAKHDGVLLEGVLDVYGPNKRHLFIGAFEKGHADIHRTAYGNMSGSMILLNIYHNLVMHHNRPKGWFYLVMLAGYIAVSASIFYGWPHVSYSGKSIIKRYLALLFTKNFHYVLLFLFTLMANLWFGKVTNIVVLFPVVFFFYAIQDHKKIRHVRARKVGVQKSTAGEMQ